MFYSYALRQGLGVSKLTPRTFALFTIATGLIRTALALAFSITTGLVRTTLALTFSIATGLIRTALAFPAITTESAAFTAAIATELAAFTAATSTATTAPAALEATGSATGVGKTDFDIQALLTAGALRVLGRQVDDLLLFLLDERLLVEDERLLPLRIVLALTRLANVELGLLALPTQRPPFVQRQLLRLLIFLSNSWSLFSFPAI